MSTQGFGGPTYGDHVAAGAGQTAPSAYGPPPAVPGKAPSRTPWIIAVAVLAVVAAVALGFAFGRGGSKPAGQPTAKAIVVTGSLDLYASYPIESNGQPCEGNGGYSDITAGATVVIYDSTGKSVAIGGLSDGTVVPGDQGPFEVCHFLFSVRNVPAGAGPYAVEVSHRGKITFSEASAGNVQLRLGN